MAAEALQAVPKFPSPKLVINPWSLSPQQVLGELESHATAGLTDGVAVERKRLYGLNRLPESSQRSAWQLLVNQFLDRMVLLLSGAAVISLIIGDVSDAVLITIIVLANAFIGFFQEWKAERAVDALKSLVEPNVSVLRNGGVRRIPASDLVPGDIIHIKAGDAVPADSRLIQGIELEVNESALTGESLAVEKSVPAIPVDTILAERNNMLYCGSAVTRGHGTAVVTYIGKSTELGRIAGMLHAAEAGPTPLQRRLATLSGQMAIIVLGACLIIFSAGLLREPYEQWSARLFTTLLLTAVSLAVAAIPEGLPAIVTVTLALGAQRMARRNAIVRRLSAVESLGSVTVICTDKTGTLTQNRMKATDVFPANKSPNELATAIHGLHLAAALCNDAEMDEENRPVGSPTEQCLLEAALSAGIDIKDVRQKWRRLDEQPFSSARKRMATLHESTNGSRVILMKGAAERVIEHCTVAGYLNPDSLDLCVSDGNFYHQIWVGLSAELGLQGKRVLAVAARPLTEAEDFSVLNDGAENRFVLLGIVGIEDPVRPEARKAIQLCHSAGIHTIMITGDQVATARSIASQTDLAREPVVVVAGHEVEKMSQSQLEADAPETSVFARVTPEHKLRIVNALQAGGHVVAMTGDGVNDGPALKQADIGIAMGVAGTDVAREASEMVLADDNFATIVGAVEEGRIIYDNIRKFIGYLLSANISELLVLLIGILAGWPLPLLPAQILWINLITDGLPALALGFEKGEPNVMKRRPRERDASILGDGLGPRIAVIGSVMAFCCLTLFYLAFDPQGGDAALIHTRTMVFTSLAVSQLLIVLSLRSNEENVWQAGLLSNYRLVGAVAAGVVLQILAIYLPLAQRFLHTASLTTIELFWTLFAAAIPCCLLELNKVFFRKDAVQEQTLTDARTK